MFIKIHQSLPFPQSPGLSTLNAIAYDASACGDEPPLPFHPHPPLLQGPARNPLLLMNLPHGWTLCFLLSDFLTEWIVCLSLWCGSYCTGLSFVTQSSSAQERGCNLSQGRGTSSPVSPASVPGG